MDKVPDPGSDEAVKLSCCCPVLDNNFGQGFTWRNENGERVRSFWISAKCPLHGSGGAEQPINSRYPDKPGEDDAPDRR